MKKVIKVAALTVALMGLTAGNAMAAEKIGVINFAELYQSLPQREASDAQLKKEFEPRANEIKKMEKDGADLLAKYKKDASFMSAEQKKQSQEKLSKLQADYQKKRVTFEKDFSKRKAEENKKIMAVVKNALDAVAKEEGYDLILDQQAVPYSAGELNLTPKVLSKAGK